MPESAFLDHYGRTLSACEINATFYRLQTPSTVERWRWQLALNSPTTR